MDSLSVVIPARDEAGNIGRTVREIREVFSFLREDLEVIVISDHSTDATFHEARLAGAKTFDNPNPAGYGYAVRCGLRLATHNWVTIMVADGSDSPLDLLRLWTVRTVQKVDGAFGHRFIPGARVTDYPPVKRVANRLGNRLAALALYTDYTDLTNPFKLYRTEVVREYLPRLTATDFSLGLELTARFIQDHRPFVIMPIDWQDRQVGTSKFKVKHALGFLRTLHHVVTTHAPLL